MAQTNLRDRDALAAAIEMEERGYTFFKDSAAKAGNSFAMEVFDFLSGEELRHLEAIRKFQKDFLAGKSGGAETLIDGMKAGRKITALQQLFDGLSKTSPVGGNELDVYKFAMDFELKGEAFYKKAEAEAVDTNAKKLYGFLVGEERKHFKIVESCLAYFENPAEFFHQREKWHLEG